VQPTEEQAMIYDQLVQELDFDPALPMPDRSYAACVAQAEAVE
jgi:hypothetical protein